MAEPKINIHCDIFQALLGLTAVCEKKVEPFEVLHEAQFVIQEVLAGRMDFDTVTPEDDPRFPTMEDFDYSITESKKEVL